MVAKIIAVGLSLCGMLSSKGIAQVSTSNRQNFQQIRQTDFSRLLGSDANFDGVTLKYDQDKTVVNGGAGIKLSRSGHRILAVNASLGTSNDLSDLFDQSLLPVFSIGTAYNQLVWGTKYFYDGTYPTNFTALQGTGALNGISTNTGQIRYKTQIRKKTQDGTYDANTRVYTFKRLVWYSLSAKYNNDQYGFFDNSRPFQSQKYDTAFQTFIAQGSLNVYLGWNKADYKWRRYRPEFIFLSVFLKASKNNNISEIKKVTSNDIKETIIDPTSNITREVIGKSKSSYQGKYVEYFNTVLGAKLLVAPARFITLDFFGEYHFVAAKDKENHALNDNIRYGTGIYFYTGKDDKSKINIGFQYKRVQNISDYEWTNRFELATSVPISLF